MRAGRRSRPTQSPCRFASIYGDSSAVYSGRRPIKSGNTTVLSAAGAIHGGSSVIYGGRSAMNGGDAAMNGGEADTDCALQDAYEEELQRAPLLLRMRYVMSGTDLEFVATSLHSPVLTPSVCGAQVRANFWEECKYKKKLTAVEEKVLQAATVVAWAYVAKMGDLSLAYGAKPDEEDEEADFLPTAPLQGSAEATDHGVPSYKLAAVNANAGESNGTARSSIDFLLNGGAEEAPQTAQHTPKT
eukprot:317817-Rhodomonas_salina.1